MVSLPLIEQVLLLLERSIPLDAIYLDKASHIEPVVEEQEEKERFLRDLAAQILTSLGKNSEAGTRFLEALGTVEPFNTNPELSAQIARRLSND
jgi:hypothetical protein